MWDKAEDFAMRLTAILESTDDGSDLQNDLRHLYETAAREIIDDEIQDLEVGLSDRRSEEAALHIRLRERWGTALDLYELLLDRCWRIGSGANKNYRNLAAKRQDHRFEALIRLHGKAVLTSSEILALLSTGHSIGAFARWRTLHETDVLTAFLYENSDEIAYRYLRHEDAQTLKMRNAYDRYHSELGYEPNDPAADGDPEELRDALVKQFGTAFLKRNGWAEPVFGRVPNDSDIETSVELDHYRPHYYLASDGIHPTPKGLKAELQQTGSVPIIMAGPSMGGLSEAGHSAALSLVRCTVTVTNYCGLHLSDDPGISEHASSVLAMHSILELSERIGQAFSAAHDRLDDG